MTVAAVSLPVAPSPANPGPPPMRATTIVVSGYPPILATALVVNGRWLGTATSSVALKNLAPGEPVPPPPKIRCGSCLVHHFPRALLGANVLGTAGYCPSCVARMLASCRRQHGRVPTRGEFYCPGCGQVYPVAQLCPPDLGGKRRWRCKPCRAVQWRRANATRQAKG